MKFSVLLVSLVFVAAPVYAQDMKQVEGQNEKVVPRTKAEANFSFAPVVRKTAPAVVNIYTKQRVQVTENASPFMNDPFFQQFFGQQGQGVPSFSFGGRTREAVTSSLGSGVIINPKGFIVTAHHVIKDAQTITVVLSNKEEYDAKVVMKDPKADLAFLKIDSPEALPFIEMRDSDTLEVGDLVLAIGNPFGVGQTVTNGIVSALARKAEGVSDYQYFIQTDAAINPGNSGGALVTTDGKLIGINTAIYSRSGGSQGIGFAIPSNIVRSLMDSKVEGGHVVHPWFGVQVQTVTREIAESLSMKFPQGVIVRSVYPDSPAQKNGMKIGDVITSVNGASINSPEDLQYRLVLSKIGESSTFDVLQGGASKTLTIPLIAPPEIPKADPRDIKGLNPLDGLTVANLSPALALEVGMDEMATGVMVVGGGKSTHGINIGWGRGDIIVEINGVKVTSSEQLVTLLKKDSHNWQIVYKRNGQLNALTVRM